MKAITSILSLAIFNIAMAQHSHDTASATAKTVSEILLEQLLTKKDLKNNMVRLETVVFPPGYNSKVHVHPCPLFVYVLEGELLSEFEGVKKIYKPGDTFYEKSNGLHSITKNISASIPVKILVIYLMKEGMETFAVRE